MLVHVLGAVQTIAGSAAQGPGQEHGGNLPLEALMWGSLSAVSLPIGAVLGIYLSPVNPYIVANTIAFGAGCLLFAVTIELYGEQLHHVEADGFKKGKQEMAVCLVSAVLGSIIYLYLNRWVEGEEGDSIEHFGHEAGIGDVERPRPSVAEPGSRAHTNLGRLRNVVKQKIGVARLLQAGAGKARFKALHVDSADEAKNSQNAKLAMGMLVGIVADGIPEAVLIGFLASENELSLMFVFSLFVANFPESFSSASLMHEMQTFSDAKIVMLWTIPMVLTGCLSALACWLVPPWAHATQLVKYLSATIEGIAGGMMLAMIASVMLPHSYTMAKEASRLHRGDVPGVLCVCGFLTAVAMKVAGGYAEEVMRAEEIAATAQDTVEKVTAHFF